MIAWWRSFSVSNKTVCWSSRDLTPTEYVSFQVKGAMALPPFVAVKEEIGGGIEKLRKGEL
jgi:hypothetical protein